MQVEVSNHLMNKHANTTIQKASQRWQLRIDDLWSLKNTKKKKKNIIAKRTSQRLHTKRHIKLYKDTQKLYKEWEIAQKSNYTKKMINKLKKRNDLGVTNQC